MLRIYNTWMVVTDDAKNINKRPSAARNHEVPMLDGIIITNHLLTSHKEYQRKTKSKVMLS